MAHDGSGGPTLMTRLAAMLSGEVSATTVEAYRRAGAVAYEDLMRAESARCDLIGTGVDLWSAGIGSLSQFLCTWNAFALQVLGDELVEADYRAMPRTVGYLPAVTAEQAAGFLGEVAQWSARARRAAADPRYDVGAEVSVPVSLPAWVEVEPCPRPHLDAMVAAATTLRDHAATALADFIRAGISPDKKDVADRIAGMVAEADGVVSHAAAMWSASAPEAVHEAVERSVKRGVEAYYLIGQLLAMPALMDRPATKVAMVTGSRLPLPGEPGFDPWCLTDPDQRAMWQRDPAARRAVEVLWRHDPDPAATLAIQAQIDAAVAAGAAVRGVTANGQSIGNYYCCPWSAIHLVLSPVVIDGRRLRAGEEFAFDVSAEELAEGGAFKRELVLGPFHPTSEVDYCDPTTGGHRD
jgi:hypothetical protein